MGTWQLLVLLLLGAILLVAITTR